MKEIKFKIFLEEIKQRLANCDTLQIPSERFPEGFADTFGSDPLNPTPDSLHDWVATEGLQAKFVDYGRYLYVKKLAAS